MSSWSGGRPRGIGQLILLTLLHNSGDKISTVTVYQKSFTVRCLLIHLHTLSMVVHNNYFHTDQSLTIVQYIMDSCHGKFSPSINTLLNQLTYFKCWRFFIVFIATETIWAPSSPREFSLRLWMEGKKVITSCRKHGCSRPLVPIIFVEFNFCRWVLF